MVLVAELVVAEVAGLSQQPLEVLPCRADVELGGGLLDEGAGGHHHDVRVLREVADEDGEVGVLHLGEEGQGGGEGEGEQQHELENSINGQKSALVPSKLKCEHESEACV